jgi:hypothetical protein
MAEEFVHVALDLHQIYRNMPVKMPSVVVVAAVEVWGFSTVFYYYFDLFLIWNQDNSLIKKAVMMKFYF